jgi:hypothetical protein
VEGFKNGNMRPEYKFIKPLPIVGSKEHRLFKKFLSKYHDFSTTMQITSIKEEYLILYWNEFISYLQIKDQSTTQ